MDGLPRDGRMLVMTSGRKALLQDRLRIRPRRAAPRAGAVAPRRRGGPAARSPGARAVAASQAAAHGRIYFLTDGAFDPDVDPGSPQVVFRVVGRPARNVAITRFDFRQERASDDRFQVLMTVRNYTDAPVAVPASVSLDGRVLFRRSLELAARDEADAGASVHRAAPSGRRSRASTSDDDLAADNQAFAAVERARSAARAVVQRAATSTWRACSRRCPNLELVKREWSPAEDIARLARSHDVVVFDGMTAPQLPPGNFLLVNTVAPGLPFSDAGRVAQPGILGRGPSALMRDVDLTAVRIDEARRVVVREAGPGTAAPVLVAGNGPRARAASTTT